MSQWSEAGLECRIRPLTDAQVEVLDVLDAVYPSALDTLEIVERRTGARNDGNATYRALRGLEARGIVAVFRSPELRSVAWSVIR